MVGKVCELFTTSIEMGESCTEMPTTFYTHE